MATLRDIRSKLKSVENIKKITQAMEMVAASRLKRAQAKAEHSRPYTTKLKEILDNIILEGADLNHPLIKKREKKKIGLIILAGDKGLCGGYNNSIFAKAESFLINQKAELILAGRKTIEYFSSHPVKKKIPEWGGKITLKQIKALSEEITSWYLSKEVDEIWIIYSHYVSVMTRDIRAEKLLNIETQAEKTEKKINYIFEPDPEKILTDLLPRYLMTKLQNAFNESYASELAARILSMRTATKNAEELIEKLTLTRNKVRQASITNEMIEITR